LRDWIELGETGAIKELVKLGLGVSMMAPWIIRVELHEKSLCFLPSPGGTVRRTWCVAAVAGRDLSVAEQTFVGLCESVGNQISGSLS
jgi:DNA-binding transcriptional LysR family regulator